MSELKTEERTWEPGEAEIAIAELKEGLERLKGHVKAYRAKTAPKTEDEKQETS